MSIAVGWHVSQKPHMCKNESKSGDWNSDKLHTPGMIQTTVEELRKEAHPQTIK